MRFLLDTNVLSEPLKREASPAVLSKLTQRLPSSATAAPVWFEIWHGMRRMPVSDRRAVCEAYFYGLRRDGFTILPYDKDAAEWHAAEQARLAGAGKPAPTTDGEIAAIAAVNDLTLVTRNVGDFEVFSGLKVDNWF